MRTYAVVFVVHRTHANTRVLVGFCVVRNNGHLDHIGPDIVEILANSKGALELVENIKIKLDGTFIEKLTISDRYDWETTRAETLKEHNAFGYTIEFTSEGVYLHYSHDADDHERLTLPQFKQLIKDWEGDDEGDDLCKFWHRFNSETRHHVLRVLIHAAKAAVTPEDDGPQNKKDGPTNL